MASRVTTVETYARGDSMRSPCSRVRCSRRRPSWTTSSASLTLPSIRYAIANAGGRSSSSRSVLAIAQPSPRAKPSRQLG